MADGKRVAEVNNRISQIREYIIELEAELFTLVDDENEQQLFRALGAFRKSGYAYVDALSRRVQQQYDDGADIADVMKKVGQLEKEFGRSR